ncbi:MAG: hypothetical protein H6822_16180 [Planctomycetaceae bacterium]|nr:hypothetical protein [Planctomycetales bacterium]MCB9923720.1 hypothetical protein [Planctomycetaceae bacterium]
MRPDTSQMHVSRFDQVASLVVALLIMVGVAVVGMFIIWLTATLVFVPRSVPVKLVENVPGRGDHAEGFERDLEAPGMEEMPELAEPQLEVAMEAMTEAVSSVAAAMDSVSMPSDATSKGEGGMGDSRPPGPLGEGDNIIPRWERWEIRFESSSETAYARQLDAFKIELGAAGGGKKNVDYARNLSKGKPDVYSGPGDKEQRLYMTWRGGNLQKFDQNLLRKAGVNITNRLLMQFYPEEVEDQLAWIEKEHADKQGKVLAEYLKTVFELKPKGSGWEFVVAEMRFRPKPK